MALGQNIHILRQAAGLTLAALGEKVGTSAQTISKLEKTDAKRSEYAMALAKVFNLPGGHWLTDLDITEQKAPELLRLAGAGRTCTADEMSKPGTVLNELISLGLSMLVNADDEGRNRFIRLSIGHFVPLKKKHFFIGAVEQDESVWRDEALEEYLKQWGPIEDDSGMSPLNYFDPPTAPNVRPAPTGTRKIPVLSYVQAGEMTEAGQVDLSQVYDDYLTTDLELSNQSFALEIKGDSMVAPPGSGEDSFHEGDRIIVDCSLTPLPGDFVVAKNGEHEATFKKYRPRGADERGRDVFELVPLNPDYPTMRSDRQVLRIVGVMVEHRRYRKRR